MKGRLLGLGVGPGDPELITLKALRLLQSAPVASTATLTESKTGTLPSSTHSPPLPGRTPPTTCVPYSSMRWE